MASKFSKLLRCKRKFLNYSTYKAVRSFSVDPKSNSDTGAYEQSNSESTKTHFGFQTVDKEDKQHKVNKVFGNVAEKYDLMNDVMSVGIHRLWKDYFVERFAPQPGTQLIDVAGGTGDIAFRFLKYIQNEESSREAETGSRFDIHVKHKSPEFEELHSDSDSDSDSDFDRQMKISHVTVCDINPAMLEVGQRKARELGHHEDISWMVGNAEDLKDVPDDTYDAYTIAFGIRNCTNVDKVLEEAHRILKPGGRFMCLEFSRVPNPALRWLYDEYSFQVIPPMGQIVARDWHSYQYLVESIRKFPNQEDFSAMIRDAGFKAVHHENLSFGIAAIHSGFKL